MNVGLCQAAAALDANSRWQEVVADNLASSSLPGYKREELSMAAVQAGLMPYVQPGQANEPQTFVLPEAGAATNFEAGELKQTAVKSDLALDGKGFFTIGLPNGRKGFTRDGEFRVSTAGQLVTKEGYPVMGTLGPIQLNKADPAFTVTDGGVVQQSDGVKGQLALTDFDKPDRLTPISVSYFAADSSKVKTVPTTATVRQGYIEGSNVSSVREMVSLLSAMRGYESSQKVIQMEDDRMGHAISELGNPSQ